MELNATQCNFLELQYQCPQAFPQGKVQKVLKLYLNMILYKEQSVGASQPLCLSKEQFPHSEQQSRGI